VSRALAQTLAGRCLRVFGRVAFAFMKSLTYNYHHFGRIYREDAESHGVVAREGKLGAVMASEEARARLEQSLEEYLTVLDKEKRYSRNTIAAYRNDLGQFLEYLAETSVGAEGMWSELDAETMSTYVTRMKHIKLRDSAGREKPIAMSTIARKIAALKSFCRYLRERGLVEGDLTKGLEAPKVKKRLPRTLTGENIERLLAAPGNSTHPKALRDRALLELLYATGMRVSELVALSLDDLNLVTNEVRVRNDRGNKDRIIPIHDRAMRALRDYLDRSRPSLLKDGGEQRALFLNHRGQNLTRQGMWLIIKEYAEQAAIPFEVTPHTLRHSFAAHMLEQQKATLQKVQEFLGHASVSTTQIYSQLNSNSNADAESQDSAESDQRDAGQ
jgi:integrase/recombinase XerD